MYMLVKTPLSFRAKRRISVTQSDATEILPPFGRLNDNCLSKKSYFTTFVKQQ